MNERLPVFPCLNCANFTEGDECLAFPDGIPPQIISWDRPHTKPYPGDNGIRFEPIKQDEDFLGREAT